MNALVVCTQCGFTRAEFLARGLLGCPACYAHFGDALRADLLHLHPALHRLPRPASDPAAEAAKAAEDTGVLRERLGDALRHERYEEAAALRRRLGRRPDASSGARGAPPDDAGAGDPA